MTNFQIPDPADKDSETLHILPVADSSDTEWSTKSSYQQTDNHVCTTRISKNIEDATKEVDMGIEKEAEEVEGETEATGFSSLSRKSKILLLLCSVANFASCLSYAVPSPFYPEEAELKGISTEMVGFFFSVYEIVVFTTSPLFGIYISKIGPRFMLLAGIFLAGAGSIIFGLLGDAPAGDSFLLLSLLNRALIAVGYSSFVTSMQVTVLTQIPGNEGLAFSLMEGSAGAGFMVGPAVGGAMFEIGGFGLPFYVIGGVVSLCGGVLYFVLPPIEAVEEKKNQPSVFRILLSPLVWVSLLCIMVCAVGMGFLDPTLAKHLEPFNLSTGVVGLFFLMASLVYCVFTPVWGWMSDNKKIGQGILLVTGALSTGVAFLIIGPSPWLGFLPYEIWTIIPGLVLMGMSQPSGMIPTIKCLMMAAVDCGLDDGVDTYGMVVGLYNFAYSLGAALGPLIAGFLVDYYSFNTGVNTVGCANFATAAISLIYFLIRYKTRTKKSYEVIQEEIIYNCSDDHLQHNKNKNNKDDNNPHQQQNNHKKANYGSSRISSPVPYDVTICEEVLSATLTPNSSFASSFTSVVESDTPKTTTHLSRTTTPVVKDQNSQS